MYLEWTVKFKLNNFLLFFVYHFLLLTTGPVAMILIFSVEGKAMATNMQILNLKDSFIRNLLTLLIPFLTAFCIYVYIKE